MRTQALIIAIAMQLVAAIYTGVIHDCVIEPMHIAHMSIEWIWLSIPALFLTIGSLWIMVVHGSHTFDIGHWKAKDMHVLDKHHLS